VAASAPAAPPPAKAKKLSFKEQRELDGLPAAIAALETEQKEIADALADGSLFASLTGENAIFGSFDQSMAAQ
jgi:ATP-binding cassette subfamily F protein uup